jgi:hypothetical protein
VTLDGSQCAPVDPTSPATATGTEDLMSIEFQECVFCCHGSLEARAVELTTNGRLLFGQPDSVAGFGTTWVVSDDPEIVAIYGRRHFPALVRTGHGKDRVSGSVYAVTSAELQEIDGHSIMGARREAVLLVSGRSAWVYLNANADAPG